MLLRCAGLLLLAVGLVALMTGCNADAVAHSGTSLRLQSVTQSDLHANAARDARFSTRLPATQFKSFDAGTRQLRVPVLEVETPVT